MSEQLFYRLPPGICSCVFYVVINNTLQFQITILIAHYTTFFLVDSRFLLFEELYEVDKAITDLARNFLQATRDKVRFGIVQKQGVLHNTAIAGSICEGGCVARVFRPVNGTVHREIEADVEVTLLEIPECQKNIVQDIPDKKGFAKILARTDVLESLILDSDWKTESQETQKSISKFCDSNYFKPYALKDEIRKHFKISNSNRYVSEAFLTTLLGGKVKMIFKEPEVTKATVTAGVDIYLNGKQVIKAAVDVATLVQINWWPEVAREWIFRKRKWPDASVIGDLTKCSYLITKSYDDPGSEKGTTELRYSFAYVEKELISRRSSNQAYTYLIFKSMFYKWIKPIDPEQISSFIAKTIMFWVCEKYPPDCWIWQKDSCAFALTHLFLKLLSTLENEHLPYYFIPSINVIEKVNHNARAKIISKVKEIVLDIEMFIPDNVVEVIEVSRDMINLINALKTLEHYYHEKFTKKLFKKFCLPQERDVQSLQRFTLFTIIAMQEILFYLVLIAIELNRFNLIYRPR